MSKKGKAKKAVAEILPARSDYAIIILNASDESVEPTLDTILEQIQTKSRRAVVALNLREIIFVIQTDKGKEGARILFEDLKDLNDNIRRQC